MIAFYGRTDELVPIDLADHEEAPVGYAAVGSSRRLRGYDEGVIAEVTLLEIADPAVPQDTADVPAGKRAVAVKLAVQSIGTVECNQTIAFGAKLIDASDQQYEYASVRAGGPELGNIRLATGERRVGTVVFLIPDGEQPAAFQLVLDSGYGPDAGRWKLSA